VRGVGKEKSWGAWGRVAASRVYEIGKGLCMAEWVLGEVVE
jgi:hypothetical protein